MCSSIIWPEPGLEIFLPLFAPRASPLNILSVNLSKQAHFFWGRAGFRCTIEVSVARCGFPLHAADKERCMDECKIAPQTLQEDGETVFPGATCPQLPGDVPLLLQHLL